MSNVADETSDTQPGTTDAPPVKRHRPKRALSISPEKQQNSLQNLPGGSCVKCDHVLGSDCKAVQCDLCGAWIHAKCEGISDEIYDKMNVVLGGLNNFVYYCESNNCISRIKQLLYTYFTSEIDSSQPQITEQHDGLSKQISDLSQKIADLSDKQQSLQETVQNISSQIEESTSDMDTNTAPVISTPKSALDIVDEMADRERRKQNVVVYNFKECADRKADIEAFQAICATVFKLDANICKAIRLGAKNANKPRPLLLVVEDIDHKNYLLSHSHYLRRHDQYNKVYVVPDRTKHERTKHQKAVEEIRQRRAKGETGLIICNGIVTVKQPRSSKNTGSSDSNVHVVNQPS